jgi:flagellar secretion chaperone FliS
MYRDAYLETEILSASPVRLVELLYRGAIESLRGARSAVENRQIAERNRLITKGQAILAELALSLNHERGGQLSKELVELYDYMQRRLNEANANQSGEPLDEVCRLLETLLEGWLALVNEPDAVSVPSAFQMPSNQPLSQFGRVDFETSRVDSLG